MLLIFTEFGISSVVQPALVEAFASDISTMVWFSVIYMVTSTGLMYTGGWLGDTLGRRRVYLSGVVVSTIGMGLVSVSQDLVQLFACRVLQGIGLALLFSNGTALITAAFPKREMGRAIGFLSVIIGLGFGVGPFLGGLLLEHLDWRAAYWTRMPMGVVGVVLAIKFIREQRVSHSGPVSIDYRGIILLYAVISVFLLAMNQAGRVGLGSPLVWGLGVATLVLVPLLVSVERRAINPVIDLNLFRIRVFTVSHITNILQLMASGALLLLAPFYLLDGLDVSLVVTGIALGVLTGVRILVGPVVGILYDKVGSRILTFVGLVVMATGFVFLGQVVGTAPMWLLLVLFAVIGVGTSATDVVNVSAIMSAVPRERFGNAAASLATFGQIAISIGFALGGAIFTARELTHSRLLAGQDLMGATVAARATVAAFDNVILVLVIVVFLAAVVTLFRGRV